MRRRLAKCDAGSFVGTSSISLAPPQAAGLVHSAAPPLKIAIALLDCDFVFFAHVGATLAFPVAPHTLQSIDDNELRVRMIVKNCSICCSNPCLSVSAMIAKCSVGGASSVRSKSRVWMRWNESSRLRYSASPCVVAKFQSACPCATHKQSHKASQDLPIFGAPARMCKPSGISSSTRKCVGSYVLFCRSSALIVCSLFILSPPFDIVAAIFIFDFPHRYRNIRIDF